MGQSRVAGGRVGKRGLGKAGQGKREGAGAEIRRICVITRVSTH